MSMSVEKRSRWLSNVRTCEVQERCHDRTQHSQEAAGLEWDLGEDNPHVAHVVPGNSGLLSRSELKALGATVDLKNDHFHLEKSENHPEALHDSSWPQ